MNFIQYRTLLGKGGKSGALGESNVTKRELCNENRSFLSILVAIPERRIGVNLKFFRVKNTPNSPPLQGGDRFSNPGCRERKSGVVGSISQRQPPLRRSPGSRDSRRCPRLSNAGNLTGFASKIHKVYARAARRDCNTIFQEALLLIHAILPAFKKCPVPKYFIPFRAKSLRIVFLLFFLTVWGVAQKNPESVRQELRKLRTEISELESKLKSAESTLQNELARMKNFDQQVTLLKKALRLLKGEIRKSEREVANLNIQIDTLNIQIRRLRQLFQEQVVFAYKYQKGRELDWLLGSGNFNQAMVRYRYFQAVSKNSRRMYERLRQKQKQLIALQTARTQKLKAQQQLAVEKAAEQKSREQKKRERQKLVSKISRDKKLYKQAIAEKMESYERLKNIIGSLEKKRKQGTPEGQPNIDWRRVKGDFSRQKRKLNWPVRGKVLRSFGKHKNPRLKTVLVNNGIDIKAGKGTEVRCVFSGVVSTITYISGFGNTLILDHNNGYYTVYAHLDEIYVNKFQVVDAGTVLGTVGDSGSLEGSMLHFEIYGNSKPLNPAKWLKK